MVGGAPAGGGGAARSYFYARGLPEALPENFWKPAFQCHANGVERIAGAVVVAETPAVHRDFILAFTGSASARDDGDGFAVTTVRGEVAVMTPATFTRHFGMTAPDVTAGARLAALRFADSDAATLERALQQSGLPLTRAGGTLVVEPESSMGAVLVFEASRA